jgi:hypothetical protein
MPLGIHAAGNSLEQDPGNVKYDAADEERKRKEKSRTPLQPSVIV